MKKVLTFLKNIMDFQVFNINFGSNVYLTDFLDVVIIAIFAYIAILFLKQTRSLAAFIGISVLGIVYVLAKTFHLYITAVILQSFFSIFVVVLVVVFQDELKRSFELIATTGTRRMRTKSLIAFSSTIFSIVQATSNLMRKKHGALIIIPGKELIERHTRGGNILDGVVTAPLLESIFDPDSPGHDGAVIIDKDRISKFSIHLPLSENLRQIKERGTRHSAAIGISERSDALAIVVSEERGEISIAKHGKMKILKDTQELEKHLNQHYKEKFPEKPASFFKNLFKKRGLEKIAAVVVACLAWFFIVFQAEIVQRDFNIPVSYTNISEEKIIESTTPETVTITLSARGQNSLSALPSDAIRINIQGEKIKSGINEIELNRSHITHPFNVSIVNINPPVIEVKAQEYRTEELLVELNIKNNNQNGRIKEISIFPNRIKVLIPEEEETPQSLLTEIIDIDAIEETEEIETKIILPESYKIHKDSTRTVRVTFVIEKNNSQ
jgi:diadenylate cyclase